jgi:hypothetical protein
VPAKPPPPSVPRDPYAATNTSQKAADKPERHSSARRRHHRSGSSSPAADASPSSSSSSPVLNKPPPPPGAPPPSALRTVSPTALPGGDVGAAPVSFSDIKRQVDERKRAEQAQLRQERHAARSESPAAVSSPTAARRVPSPVTAAPTPPGEPIVVPTVTVVKSPLILSAKELRVKKMLLVGQIGQLKAALKTATEKADVEWQQRVARDLESLDAALADLDQRIAKADQTVVPLVPVQPIVRKPVVAPIEVVEPVAGAAVVEPTTEPITEPTIPEPEPTPRPPSVEGNDGDLQAPPPHDDNDDGDFSEGSGSVSESLSYSVSDDDDENDGAGPRSSPPPPVAHDDAPEEPAPLADEPIEDPYATRSLPTVPADDLQKELRDLQAERMVLVGSIGALQKHNMGQDTHEQVGKLEQRLEVVSGRIEQIKGSGPELLKLRRSAQLAPTRVVDMPTSPTVSRSGSSSSPTLSRTPSSNIDASPVRAAATAPSPGQARSLLQMSQKPQALAVSRKASLMTLIRRDKGDDPDALDTSAIASMVARGDDDALEMAPPSMLAPPPTIGAPPSPPSPPAEFLSPRDEQQFFAAVAELASTEGAHVAAMTLIVAHYIEPLRKRALLTPAQIDAVFRTTEVLLEAHGEIEQELVAVAAERERARVIELLNDVMPRACAKLAPLMVEFARGARTSASLVVQLRREHEAFAHHCQVRELAEVSRGQALADFLIRPIQRVCRYPLLLREIERHGGVAASLAPANDAAAALAQAVNDSQT